MAPAGRITRDVVDGEIARLERSWRRTGTGGGEEHDLEALMGPRYLELDEFDRVQLARVVRVCRASKSLSDAGRQLFAVSRQRRKIANDADRLRKYLSRFELEWKLICT